MKKQLVRWKTIAAMSWPRIRPALIPFLHPDMFGSHVLATLFSGVVGLIFAMGYGCVFQIGGFLFLIFFPPPSDLEWVGGRRQALARRAAVTGFGAIARVAAGRHCVTDSPAPAQFAAAGDGPQG